MTPEEVAAFRDLQLATSYMGVLMWVMGGVLWWLFGKVGKCALCSHCQQEAAKSRKGPAVDSSMATRERLFGRAVVPVEDESELAPVEGSSGDQERDAEPEDPGR